MPGSFEAMKAQSASDKKNEAKGESENNLCYLCGKNQ